MNNLVVANLKHHPGRTLTSVAGVAIGVILVVLTVGLVRGALRDRGQRDTNTGVEIMLSQRDLSGLSVASLPISMPLSWIDRVREVDGVADVVAVGQYIEMKGEGGLGIRQIDGVQFENYSRATPVRIIDGHPLPAAGESIIVDFKYAAAHKTKLGEKIPIFNRDFTVIGVYEPETGARMMIPLATMQEMLGAPDQCSMLLVKCQNGEEQENVGRRIVERFPDLRVIFTRDLPKLFAEGYSSFNIFLNVVAALAVGISLLVISLTMYAAVTERTKQIGIMKSLGASKGFIASVFLKESLMISAFGVASGHIAALLVRALLMYTIGTKIEIEADYLLAVTLGGLGSGVFGALLPAMRAASLDPVLALSNE
jgi:putative ABC transport system permease protein